MKEMEKNFDVAMIRSMPTIELVDAIPAVKRELHRRATIEESLAKLNDAMYELFMNMWKHDGHIDLYNSATGEVLFSLNPELFEETPDIEEHPAFTITGGQG